MATYSDIHNVHMNLTLFKDALVKRCGLVFENEKTALLEAGIRTRMSATGISAPEQYLELLLGQEAEFSQLVDHLTINETYFFREPVHFTILAEKIIPELLRRKIPGVAIKILSAGCSTGEEAYSVVITLMEKFSSEYGALFSIFAGDIDSTVLAKAKMGIYGPGSFRGFPENLREKYFEKQTNGCFRVKKSVREKVEFLNINLLSQEYPQSVADLDIIFYRNVSIYFPNDVRTEIFSKLAGLLNPDGYIFVGAAETMFHNGGLLSLITLEGSFLFKKCPELTITDRRKHPRHGTPGCIVKDTAFRPGQRVSGHLPNSLKNIVKPFSPAVQKVRREAGQQIAPSPAKSSPVKADFDEALFLAQSKIYEKALQILDKLIAEDPLFVKAYTLKASILTNLHKPEHAAKMCVKALEVDRLCLEGYLLLGFIARMQDKEDESLKRFREAIYVNPSCWLAHFSLAELQSSRGESEHARREYEITVRILEKGNSADHGIAFFPLSFPVEQFVTLCRHRLAKLRI